MKKVTILIALVALTSTGMAVSLQADYSKGITALEHRWTFNGTLDDDAAAIGANKGAVAITGNAAKFSYTADGAAKLDNGINGWGGTQEKNVFLAMPSYVIRDSAFDGKTIEMWAKNDGFNRWMDIFFKFGDAVHGEWFGNRTPPETHPRLMMGSRENDNNKWSWVANGGTNNYDQINDNAHKYDDALHQYVITVSANNDYVGVYVDGLRTAFWSGNPWEGPGCNNNNGNFVDSINRIGAGYDDEDNWLSGGVYDFRIWGHQMTTANVQQLYSLGSEVATIPEPATLALLGLGGLSFLRRKK